MAQYIEKHRHRRPPDHLLVEFFAEETAEARATKKGRRHIAFKFNLLEHIGLASTLRPKRNDTPNLGCWEDLKPPIIFPVETCSIFPENETLCSPEIPLQGHHSVIR